MTRWGWLFGAFVVVVLAPGLRSSVGDNDERIEAIYGNIVQRHLHDDGKVSVIYHKDRYLYAVIYDNSRSVSETFSRTDNRELSPNEIARFLKVNAPRGTTWTREDNADEQRYFRSDSKAVATYGKFDGRAGLKVELRKLKPEGGA